MATRTRKTAAQGTEAKTPIEVREEVEAKKTSETTRPTVAELEKDPRFERKADFRERVKHQISDATIYNRLRGFGKGGKPIRQRLEGVQAEDGSWWVDVEGEEAKRLLHREKLWLESPIVKAAGADSSIHAVRGATPAELRKMVVELEEELRKTMDELKAAKRELEDTKCELEQTKTELEKSEENVGLYQMRIDGLTDELADVRSDLKSAKAVIERDAMVLGIMNSHKKAVMA